MLESPIKRGMLLLKAGSRKEYAMRKWYIPLTIAGLGGLGAFLLSESGRGTLRWLGGHVRWTSQGMFEWNEAAEAELQRIQDAVAALAESLQSVNPVVR